MKTGILGGTFNPIHNGHLEMAEIAIDVFGLDDIMLIPTGSPPHKTNENILSKYERYELCLMSTARYDNIFVSSVEIDRDGYTYTIDTLKELEKIYGIRDELHFIIGGDTVMKLEHWKNFREVFKRCKFIAFGRIGLDLSEIIEKIEFLQKEYDAEIGLITADIMDIASKDLRDMIKNGESVSGLIPPEAESYIKRHNLYK